MKKFSICSIFLILVLCLTTMSGCLKADSVTLSDNVSKFINDNQNNKKVDNNDIGSGILDEAYNFSFLYSDNNVNLQSFVNDENTNYFLLKNNNEYDYMIKSASTYFMTKVNQEFVTTNQEKVNTIPQYLNTTLYYSIENTTSAIKEFGKCYDKLNYVVEQNSATPSSKASQNALSSLLIQYKKLIGNVFDMNIATEQIYNNYVSTKVSDYMNLTAIPNYETKRIIETYSLYISNYIYQKYMAFQLDPTVSFRTEKLYTDFQSLVTTYRSKTMNELNDSSAAKLTVYKNLRLNEETLQNSVLQSKNAVNVLKGVVPETTDEYKYGIYNSFYNETETLMEQYIDLLYKLMGVAH